MKKQDIVIRALTEFPKMSKSAIVRYLLETYPAMFDDYENTRSIVRKVTGAQGESRLKYKVVDHNPDIETQFNLPKSKGEKRNFIDLPKECHNILIISDIHFPNHDVKALGKALEYGKANNINCIVINGDLLDNEPFTNHDAPPPNTSDVRDWFQMTEDFLDMLISEFKCPIYYIEGNHDNWYMRYLMKKAPVLFNDQYYTLSARLKLREKGIVWIPQTSVLMIGKLPVTHGHMIIKGFFSPVNPAKGVYNKIKGSMLIGHCHTTSEHSESNLQGDLNTTYSVACLCTLAPNYDPFNCKHNLGFARVIVQENGNYRVENKRIDQNTYEVY
jgi:predicted phosphodiesterase